MIFVSSKSLCSLIIGSAFVGSWQRSKVKCQMSNGQRSKVKGGHIIVTKDEQFDENDFNKGYIFYARGMCRNRSYTNYCLHHTFMIYSTWFTPHKKFTVKITYCTKLVVKLAIWWHVWQPWWWILCCRSRWHYWQMSNWAYVAHDTQAD